ncbi:MAG: YopX family protein, partial [Oscillospiraceae bacterium]|nr:YopX family protein [Oscillospiraceae bacterium]
GSYWLSRSAVRETTYITDGYGNLFCVIPETVGQYTGLNDKNNVKIFDGDIVTVENPNISDDEYGIVKFDNDGAMFIVEFDTFTVDFGNNIDGNQCEIIGNIFDNPELLKREEND